MNGEPLADTFKVPGEEAYMPFLAEKLEQQQKREYIGRGGKQDHGTKDSPTSNVFKGSVDGPINRASKTEHKKHAVRKQRYAAREDIKQSLADLSSKPLEDTAIISYPADIDWPGYQIPDNEVDNVEDSEDMTKALGFRALSDKKLQEKAQGRAKRVHNKTGGQAEHGTGESPTRVLFDVPGKGVKSISPSLKAFYKRQTVTTLRQADVTAITAGVKDYNEGPLFDEKAEPIYKTPVIEAGNLADEGLTTVVPLKKGKPKSDTPLSGPTWPRSFRRPRR